MAAQAENSEPVVQLGVVGIPVKTFRNAVLPREIAHCISFVSKSGQYEQYL